MASNTTRFQWADYLVFGISLLLSCGIGMFYGWKGRKKNTVEEFLLAGRKMNFIPVAVSLFVSWMSAISVLGDPAEVYYHGAVYWVLVVGYVIAVPVIAHVFVPVYYNMKATTVFQYLEMRFAREFRYTISLINALSLMIYLGLALYAPSVALSQVSGMEVWVSIVTSGAVCCFYTSLGGMRAVLWADTLQMVIMLVAMVALMVMGSSNVGGVEEVWRIAGERGRLNFDSINPSPFVRVTLWTCLIGGFFRVLNPYASEQYFVQRYRAAKSLTQAKLAIYLNVILFVVFETLLVALGLVLVANYAHCDPLTTGDIRKPDQLLPLLVVDVFSGLPGLAGLFLACIYSATISTLSSGQNSLSTVFLHDIISPLYKRVTGRAIPPATSIILAKALCVLLGVINICMALIFLPFSGQTIFQLAIKATGMFLAPISGIFITAVLLPFVTTLGVFLAAVCCLVIALWIGLGSLFHATPSVPLLVETDDCHRGNDTNVYTTTADVMTSALPWTTNATTIDTQSTNGFVFSDVYNLSPILYPVMGPVITMVLGAVFTLITRCFLSRRNRDQYSVDKIACDDLADGNAEKSRSPQETYID